jgi:proteasome lid subunit RPN8/RPN11
MGFTPKGVKAFLRRRAFSAPESDFAKKMRESEEGVKVSKVVYPGHSEDMSFPTYPIYDSEAHQAAIDDMMDSGMGFRTRGTAFKSFTPTASKYIKRAPSSKIVIPVDIFKKMIAYALASKGEVSGFCKVKIREVEDTKIITATDIRIFEQTVNPVHTKLRGSHLSPFIVDLHRAKEKATEWNLWWHSHNDFNTFFSREDENTIKDLSSYKGISTPATHLYSVCVNKFGEFTGRHDYDGKLVEEANVVIDYAIDREVLRATQKEVKEKVTYRETPYRPAEFRRGKMRD